LNEPSEVRSLGEDLEFWNWIAPFYDSVYTGLEGDVEFYVSLSRDRDWVLEQVELLFQWSNKVPKWFV